METKKRNFAIVGVAGFVAPRHLQAIHDTGGSVVAAMDPHDAVGVMDKYFPDAQFFTEFERFDRYVEKLRRQGPEEKVHYVTVCSPNYLHDAHIRFGLRIGADVICEKPLVLNPWNLDALEALEKEYGTKVYTVLQLRYHPSIIALRETVKASKDIYDVDLTYITPRGSWYFTSWKGAMEKSGGVATNIGIHFFDMLIWIFGAVKHSEVHASDPKRMSGYLELERARVRWYLSIDGNDIALAGKSGKTYRSLTLNGVETEFSDGFTDLHTAVYREVLSGQGWRIPDARPSIELAHKIRQAPVQAPVKLNAQHEHPLLTKKREVSK